MKERWWNRTWVRAAATVLLVGLLIAWVGPVSIWKTVRNSRAGPLWSSLLLTPVVIGIKSLRWMLLARRQSALSFGDALRSYLTGLTLATLTPLSAGEAGRGLFVRGGRPAELTGVVILDKLIDLSAVGLFAAAGLLWTADTSARAVGWGVLGGLVLAWGGVWGSLMLARPRLLRWREQARERAQFKALAVLDGLMDTPGRLIALNMLLAVIGFAAFYGQAFILLRAFWPLDLPVISWQVTTFFPIITLSTILPVAIGGVGIREWTAVVLLRQFGVPEAVAFNTFFVHFLVVQVLPALAGAVIIGSFRRKPDRAGLG